MKNILVCWGCTSCIALSAGPFVDYDFTAAEGFSDGAVITGIGNLAAQTGWAAADPAGQGYVTVTSSWNRAEHRSNVSLEIGDAVVIKTVLRLNDADGVFYDRDILRAGFAESSKHAGGPIPSIGSFLHTNTDGSYWFGGRLPESKIHVNAADAGDWIEFTQTIERGAATGEFIGTVSAKNLTDGLDLGTAASSWAQFDSDNSWGGSIDVALQCVWNSGATAIEIDRWSAEKVTLADPVTHLEFTAAEGFTDGARVNGVQQVAAQSSWVAADTTGRGYAVSSSRWQRGESRNNFTLAVGQSVVTESVIRIVDADGVFADDNVFRVGFAEGSKHTGQTIPTIGSTLRTDTDGSYWFGGDSPNNRIYIPATDAEDWINFTQTIMRDSASGKFVGLVTAHNLTTGRFLGTTYATWAQQDSDNSWGGTMQPGFYVASNSGGSNIEIDRLSVKVLATDNPRGNLNAFDTLAIQIDPFVSVSLSGKTDLDRNSFFALAADGKRFEQKVADQSASDNLIDNVGLRFGRQLGGVRYLLQYSGASVREDASRPGYVDVTHLANSQNPSNSPATQTFVNKFAPNLDIAMHDRYGGFPEFMPQWSAPGDTATHRHPINVDAGGEYIATYLKYAFTDWTRPATYEIVNEPNYRVWSDQRFAQLHTAVKDHVRALNLDTAVGGPCISVGYFYKDDYDDFYLKSFIDHTNGDLDFYSFHVYDFLRWDSANTEFYGTVTTGLPLESVFDLVQNYTHNQFNKEVDLVLSEHGGYIIEGGNAAMDDIANRFFPGSGFAWEMQRASIAEYLGISSMIANTMTFMNNLHVVRKGVPFILQETSSWDPRYGNALLVKENYDPASNTWFETDYVHFYNFFKNVQGRRVEIQNPDPDIQSQAFVDGDKLFVLLNNLAEKAQPLALNLPSVGVQSITLRRFGRSANFTPSFSQSTLASLDNLTIAGRESLALEIDYSSSLPEGALLNEVPRYGNLVTQQFSGSKTYQITTPDYQSARYATLRISVGRASGSDHHLKVNFNGIPLQVPLEDCSGYLDTGEYGSTKLIKVPVDILQATNTITASFLAGGSGGIGSVVLRVSLKP